MWQGGQHRPRLGWAPCGRDRVPTGAPGRRAGSALIAETDNLAIFFKKTQQNVKG